MATQKTQGKGKQNNGQGSTKLVTAEQHAARRKAKKASQNANARAAAAHKQNSGGSYLEGLLEDRRVKREEREAKKQELFRRQQAEVALESQCITNLKAGSIADKMARLVIAEFPNATPDLRDGKQVSRTNVAIENALLQMSDSEAAREKAIRYGVSAARSALSSAYRTLTNQ